MDQTLGGWRHRAERAALSRTRRGARPGVGQSQRGARIRRTGCVVHAAHGAPVSGRGEHHCHRPADKSGACAIAGSGLRHAGVRAGLHGRQPQPAAATQQHQRAAIRARIRQLATPRIQHPLGSGSGQHRHARALAQDHHGAGGPIDRDRTHASAAGAHERGRYQHRPRIAPSRTRLSDVGRAGHCGVAAPRVGNAHRDALCRYQYRLRCRLWRHPVVGTRLSAWTGRTGTDGSACGGCGRVRAITGRSPHCAATTSSRVAVTPSPVGRRCPKGG